jgi:hypothetical protein
MQAKPGGSLVQEFARDLRQLRIACGNPSYAKVSGLAGEHGVPVAKSTISDMLNGKRLPSRDLVMAVVKALLYARSPGGGAIEDDHEEVRAWSEKWTAVLHKAQAETTSTVDVVDPSPPPVISGGNRETGPDPQLPSGQAVVLRRPSRTGLMMPRMRVFQELLKRALNDTDDQGRVWARARFGCYAFYDIEGEPLFVGQTSERLDNRVRRHLTSQRTDAVAMHILDVQEVAEVELWPAWSLDGMSRLHRSVTRRHLAHIERAVYLHVLGKSRYGALLNEEVPPVVDSAELPPSKRYPLLDEQMRMEKSNLDLRIARNAEMLARLSATVSERGQVGEGLRRALAIRAARTADLAVRQLTYVTAGTVPAPKAIDLGDHVHNRESFDELFFEEE